MIGFVTYGMILDSFRKGPIWDLFVRRDFVATQYIPVLKLGSPFVETGNMDGSWFITVKLEVLIFMFL